MIKVEEREQMRQIKRIIRLNEKEVGQWDGSEPRNAVMWNHFRHAVEEVGEMASAIRGTNDEPLMNEAVDTAICALAIALLESHGDIDSVFEVLEQKLDKWQRRLEKHK